MSAAATQPVALRGFGWLGITAFATLPYMRTRGQILRRRMIIGSALAVAVVGIPAALWAVDTFYMPLDLLIDRAMQRFGIAGIMSGGAAG